MNIFQLVFIPFCIVQATLSLRRYLHARHLTSLVFLVAWLVAVLLIANPDMATSIANSVGIGRGVDLISYLLLMAFMWGHYQHYLRYKRVENEVTMLVRELAITQASRPAGRETAAV